MSKKGCSYKSTDKGPNCDGSRDKYVLSTLCCELPPSDPTSWEEYNTFIEQCRLKPGSNCTLPGYNYYDDNFGTVHSTKDPLDPIEYDCNCTPCSYEELHACTEKGDRDAVCRKLNGNEPTCICSENMTGDYCETANAEYKVWTRE